MVGRTISHYAVLDKLGGGGMGVVYRAEDTRLGRHVALKLLPEEYSRDRQTVERFQHEARAASALNHPHICTIYDIDEFGGQHFIVTELLEGEALKHRMADRPMRTDHVPDIAPQIGEQLTAPYMLSGSLRRAGNRLRLTAQLVEMRTGHSAWGERYD
jgi:serine/threonine protein kinase